MKVFDLHCDTLFKANETNHSIIRNDFEFSLEKAKQYDNYTQVMAIWIPDEYRNEKAFALAENCYTRLQKELQLQDIFQKCNNYTLKKSNYTIILSVEGGAVLGGDIKKVKRLKEMGVRFLTLTWNGSNEIGDGILCDNPKGLTDFGKKLIPELEKHQIVIDVSHASEPLFYDVVEYSKKPFVATHSNSRKYCQHKRNLTDEQFQLICQRGGIVGLNFHRYFITDNGKAKFSDLQNHLDHFLSLGGENHISLGSDFDGAEMPECIKGAESIATFYDYLLSQNYNETLLQKIFYDNAENFLKKYDKESTE